MTLGSRIVVSLGVKGWGAVESESVLRSLWDADNIFFLDLDGSYTSVFTL